MMGAGAIACEFDEATDARREDRVRTMFDTTIAAAKKVSGLSSLVRGGRAGGTRTRDQGIMRTPEAMIPSAYPCLLVLFRLVIARLTVHAVRHRTTRFAAFVSTSSPAISSE
jgi:hypothetical protein